MADEKTFPLNYERKFEIDITPNGASETWAPIAAGINNISKEGNEVIDQTQYYDGEGVGSSEVTGGQPVWSFSGHRIDGDAAQDFIFSLDMSYGSARKTKFKATNPDGRVVTGPCTIANINENGGDANAKNEISFEIHANGKPSVTAGAKTVAAEG